MTFVDNLFAVHLMSKGSLFQLARIGAQAHGAALVFNVFLFGHKVDHRIVGVLVELSRGCAGKARNIARELAHSRLQAQANAQERNVVLAGIASRLDLSFESTLTKAAGNQDAIHGAKRFLHVFSVQLFTINQMHFGVDAIGNASMVQRLDNGEISIGQAYVFAHHRNINRALNGIRRRKERLQRIKVDFGLLQAETLQHLGIKLLVIQRKWHFVDRRCIDAGKYVFGSNVTEQGDLFSNLLGNFMVGAAHDEIGLNTDGTQFLNAVLRGLGFNLVSCGDVRN